MKKITIALAASTLVVMLSFNISCKKKKDEQPEIKGKPGNPRFNLQFTNEQNVDLDLHVLTPNGYEIYYGNKQADKGQLDVDCLCGDCPNGPNENIYWEVGTAPSGEYKFWVEYYDDCGSGGISDFTLRLMKNSEILQTYTGTLSANGSKSQIYTFNF